MEDWHAGVVPAPAYNKGVHETLVRATRQGLSRRACAGAARVGERVVYKWLERGKRAAEAHDEGEEALAEDEKYMQLYRDIEEAMAKRELELLSEMDGEEKVGMWMKQAWKLERRDPASWGPPATRIVHEGEVLHRQTLELPQETALAMHELFSRMAKPKELTEGDGKSG